MTRLSSTELSSAFIDMLNPTSYFASTEDLKSIGFEQVQTYGFSGVKDYFLSYCRTSQLIWAKIGHAVGDISAANMWTESM